MASLNRTGSITARSEQGLSVQFGNAPSIRIPSRDYYGRRKTADRVTLGHGTAWGQLTGPTGDCLRCVTRRDNGLVQVGDAPAFVVTGQVGFRNYHGHVATYQNGMLVRRGSVLIPPDKFLGATDSGNFITIDTAALLPTTETLVIVPGAGSVYFLEDQTQKTVPAGALADWILVPSGVQVVKQAVPTAQPGKVVVPNSANLQSLPAPISWTIYEIQSEGVAIADGYMGVSQ